MSSIKMLILSIVFIHIAACSLIEPFIDRRRNAGATDKQKLYVGHSKPEAPVICYNSLWTDEQKLQEMADTECQKQQTGDYALKNKTETFSCKIFLPSRAYYQCVKNEENK